MSLRDHTRAAFVAFHLAAVLLLSFPAPVGGMTEANFALPSTQALFRQVSEGLGAVGVPLSAQRVEELAWRWGRGFMAARAQVLRPFTPYAQWTGARQGWRMFWSVNRRPAVVVVEVEEGGVWTTLYRARDPEHRFLARKLDNERFRAVTNPFAWLRDRPAWRHFARWVAVQVAQERPEATRARVLLEQRPTPSPEELRAGRWQAPRRRWEELHELPELR